MKKLELRLAAPEDAPKVEAFNRRLAEAGETYHHLSLELPFHTMVHRNNSPITVEKIFVFDDTGEIRGGIGVKRMVFRVNDDLEEVAFPVYPISEGIINKAFRGMGKWMQTEMLRWYPLTYGLGAPQSGVERSRMRSGWFYRPVHLHFAVFRGYPFLRNIAYLRKRKWLQILCDLLALSGTGTVGISILRLLQRLRNRYPNVKEVTTERFDSWEDWTDDVWEASRNHYTLIGDRSKAALEVLYPQGHEHLIKLRFKAAGSNRPLGWAVLTVSKRKNDKYFGNMVLGAMVDMLAVPDNAYEVISGALTEAEYYFFPFARTSGTIQSDRKLCRSVLFYSWRRTRSHISMVGGLWIRRQ
jgi:hypothetical protein